MSGLFGVLDIASRSLGIVQSGIRTTAHNIANVDTPGYSRQVQRLAAARPLPTPNGQIGTGVEQIGIERITDVFLRQQLVAEESVGGALLPQSRALAAIEEVFNEQQGDGISAALSDLYDAFGDLAGAASPGAQTERQALLDAARQFTDALGRADASLRAEQNAADRAATGLLPEINSLIQRIADLNGEIVSSETLAPANDLRDQRDGLMRELASKVDVRSFEEDNGAAVVMLASGHTLVEGGRARQLVAAMDPTNPFNATFSRIMYDDGVSQLDITDEIGGGELGGLLRVRDTLTASAIRSTDVIAYNAAVSVNSVHAGGFGLDGSTGNDFFTPLSAVENAARDLAVDPGVLANADTIAAGALGPDPGDNGNALALADLRDTVVSLALPGDPPGPPTGPSRTLLEHTAIVVADVGSQSKGMRDAVASHERVAEVLENRRDEISGVSLDEEVTSLVRLQAAFQANSRIIGIVDRLLQDLVDIL